MSESPRFDPTPTADEIAEWTGILFGLFGDGLTTEPGALRYDEIRSYAYVFAFASNVLTQAGTEAHVQNALDTLDEHEAWLRLPNDAGVTDAERKARVLALRSLRGMNDAAIARVFASLGALGPAEFRGVTAAEMDVELGLEPSHALTPVLLVNPADLAEPRVRQALGLVLERGLDVSRFGPNHTKGSRVLATAIGAAWESSVAVDGNAQHFDAVAIDRATDSSTEDTPRWYSRVRSFGPLTVLHRDDLRRVVRQLAMQPENGPSAVIAPTMSGDLKCVCAFSIANGTNILIEDTGVWKGRVLVYTGQAAATDVRPGGAAEDGDANRITPGFLDTGAGGAGVFATLATGVTLYADAATGLRVANASGGTRYVNLFVWAASPYAGGSVGLLEPFGLDAPSVSSLTAATWNTFIGFLGTKRGAATAAWATGELRGLVHRTCMTPSMTTPSVTGAVEYVLDSSIDWRDRFIVFSGGSFSQGIGSTGQSYPGAYHQDTGVATDARSVSGEDSILAFGYTGPGHTAATAAGQWDIAGSALPCHLYARTTGELVLVLYDTDAIAGSRRTIVVDLIGSFQLGVKVTPASEAPEIPAAVALAPMRPAHLNTPQDFATRGYGTAGDTAAPLTTIPLGLDVYGYPPIARVHKQRRDRSTGYVQDGGERRTVREKSDGGATCWSSNTYGANTHSVLDASQDWRDRWITRLGSTTLGTNASRGWYSGPGMSAAEVEATPVTGYHAWISSAVIYLYVDSTTGALVLYVGAVGATVANFVVGSPVLGGRSVPSLVRRSVRPPISVPGLFRWYTARYAVIAGSSYAVSSKARAGVAHLASGLYGFDGSGTVSTVGPAHASLRLAWIGSRKDLGPAVRVRAESSSVWASGLGAGSWAFLSQGPMTFAFAFAMIETGTPYPTRDLLTGYITAGTTTTLALMFDTYAGAANTSGVQLGIDMERNTLVFRRLQDTAGTIVFQSLTSLANIRDGLPHYAVIRQTSTQLELYVDGVLHSNGVPTAYTQPSTTQPRLSSTYFAGMADKGYMSQAGFDLFEFAMYSSALSDTDLRHLHAYLKTTHRPKIATDGTPVDVQGLQTRNVAAPGRQFTQAPPPRVPFVTVTTAGRGTRS